MTCWTVTGEKVTVEKEGGTMEKERRVVHVTGGKVKGRNEVRVEAGKKETTQTTARERSTTR